MAGCWRSGLGEGRRGEDFTIFHRIQEPTHPLRGSLGRLVGASLGREVFGSVRILNRRGGVPTGAAAFITIQ